MSQPEKIRHLEKAFPKRSKVQLNEAVMQLTDIFGEPISEELAREILASRQCTILEPSIPPSKPTKGKYREDDLDLDEILETITPAAPAHRFERNSMLLQKYQQSNDPDTLTELIISNTRLVRKFASKLMNYMSHKLTYDDLVSAGMLGLLKSFERFDPSRDNQFSTYASFWIRQRITREIIDQGNTIRIPVYAIETIRKIIRMEQKQLLEGKPIDISEICRSLDITRDKYEEYKRTEHRFLHMPSLHTSVSEQDNTELMELIAPGEREEVQGYYEQEYGDPLLVVEQDAVKQRIQLALKLLTEREQQVISYRFGFHDGELYTLEEIGSLLGVTRERIRQIEAKAIMKLKKILQPEVADLVSLPAIK